VKRSPAKADAKGWRRQTHDFQMAYARWHCAGDWACGLVSEDGRYW